MRVISVADPEHPEEVGYCHTPETAYGVTVSGDYAYVAVAYMSGGSLRIISILNPERPEEVGYYNTPDYAYNVTVSGDYVYIAALDLCVISIADPDHPEEVGYYDTLGLAFDVTISGDYAYVVDDWGGLRVISVADPAQMEEVGYFDTPGSAHGVALSEDGLIYVADGTNVGIYHFTDPAKVDDSFILHPSAFILFPPYPNPFNSTTTIRYGLPYPSNVSVKVYNLSGRRISTLFEGYRQAGIHTANLTANNLSSGLYFVRLNASDQLFTQKVMLIR